MNLMEISNQGISLIKQFEGCKLSAYKDSVGIPTIGYGHTKDVRMGMVITQALAEQYLKDDLQPVEKLLNGMGVNFKQNQFDALCSWIFNLGASKFNSSTLKKYIVANKSDVEIGDQIIRWVNAGGKPLLGLKRRRIAEANMFVGRDIYYLDSNNDIKRK